MAKESIHIGKKIKEVLDKSPMSVVDFAKSINLTRNGAYKVFEKETIDTGQLQVISKVLNHDFFAYYDRGTLSFTKEINQDNSYTSKADVSDLTEAVIKLTKIIERIEEQLPTTKNPDSNNTKVKKKYAKKLPRK